VDWTALLTDPQTYISLATLAALEIVLGIDNIIFITILAGRLPEEQRRGATRLGLAIALVARILLLLSITWLMRLTAPLFTLMGHAVTGRDLVLLLGGLFLMGKATHEIYENVERPHDHQPQDLAADVKKRGRAALTSFLIQVAMIDIVFSLDSVITAVGMVQSIPVMVAAVIIAVLVMMAFATPIGDFVHRRPSIRVLALAFLVLIGFLLMAEGVGHHVPRGYIYFAMAFAASVEAFNILAGRNRALARRKRRG
jgi:predicted tellurium resistance membrane protein TerC